MRLAYHHVYAAAPDRVVALFRTQGFIEDVAAHAGALEHAVSIQGDTTTLTMVLPVPEHLTKFVGSSLRLEQVFTFGVAEPDGTVNGAVKGSVPGMPVDIDAVAVLRPVAATTEAEFTGELRVRIPLVGKKVEAQVEPFVRDAFAGLERRAAGWLTR